MYIKKYSTLIIVNQDDTIKVKQFEDSTACVLEYRQALADGKDAYMYFIPIKRKSSVDNPSPVEVTL
jgi:hypothetical protein